MIDRVDLEALHNLHLEQDRKFPLLIAKLLASLLAEVKRTSSVPTRWDPLELCFAEMHEESAPQIESEHAQLLSAFADAGLADARTLELFLPRERYRRLLGACSLNSFELTLAHGAIISALLPGVASCFNHSCEPNLLVSCGETAEVSFVAGADIAPGDELCITYMDVSAPVVERRDFLLHKYAFNCECRRCRAEHELDRR